MRMNKFAYAYTQSLDSSFKQNWLTVVNKYLQLVGAEQALREISIYFDVNFPVTCSSC